MDHRQGKKDVPVVPCGITYLNKNRWRSQVVIHYGRPMRLTNEMYQRWKRNPKIEVKNLTAGRKKKTLSFLFLFDERKLSDSYLFFFWWKDLERSLYSLTLNSPDWETMKGSEIVLSCSVIFVSETYFFPLPVLQAVRRIYFQRNLSLPQYVEVMRR